MVNRELPGILTIFISFLGPPMRIALVLSVLALLTLPACSRKAPPIEGDFPLVKLTERAYVVHGSNEFPNKVNRGFINNPGFVLTKKGVVVVDPGSSVQVGEMLLAKIATVTKEPVIAVFNTHVHGDHWLGNDAIRRAWPKAVIYAHQNMIDKTGVEGEAWIKNLNQLTDGAVRGTQATPPNLAVENEETLAIGGVHFHIYHTGHAHTDGDLMIEVVEEKMVFLGDNVMNARAGRLDDGDIAGNIAACDVALKIKAEHFVPGHGKSGGREIVVAYRDFLARLLASVKKHYSLDRSADEIKPKVIADLAAYKGWANFDAEIGKLVSYAYRKAERDSF